MRTTNNAQLFLRRSLVKINKPGPPRCSKHRDEPKPLDLKGGQMAISIKSTSGPNPVPENSKPSPKPETHPRKRGDGYIYQREGSGSWWICYYFRGKPHRESSYSTDPAVALKKLDKHVKELWAA